MRPELEPEFLLNAYAQGYFPMPDEEEILWFRPDPRAYFDIQTFKPSQSLKRSIRKFDYRFSLDKNFYEVMKGCSERDDTWINKEFFEAYTLLHKIGFAHSIEVWNSNDLVGGVYGVQIGGLFCAESKFHRQTDASKAALWCLIESLKSSNLGFLEVQFMTDHLRSLGAREISDKDYQLILKKLVPQEKKLTIATHFNE